MKKATLQTVARDVRAIARSLAARQPANQPALSVVPLGKYELDAGMTVHENRPARLVLIENFLDGIQPASWDEVQAYAKERHASAPTRIDMLVLFARMKDRFKTDLPYWTSEEYAGSSTYAWRQWFDSGVQDSWSKDGKVRACLVRRIPI